MWLPIQQKVKLPSPHRAKQNTNWTTKTQTELLDNFKRLIQISNFEWLANYFYAMKLLYCVYFLTCTCPTFKLTIQLHLCLIFIYHYNLMHPTLSKLAEDGIITYTFTTKCTRFHFTSFLSFHSCLEIWLIITTYNASYIKAYFTQGRSYYRRNYWKLKLNPRTTVKTVNNWPYGSSCSIQ